MAILRQTILRQHFNIGVNFFVNASNQTVGVIAGISPVMGVTSLNLLPTEAYGLFELITRRTSLPTTCFRSVFCETQHWDGSLSSADICSPASLVSVITEC